MKFLKIILAAVILSIIISLAGAIAGYTPVADREPNTYYSSIGESFFFGVYFTAPLLLVLSIASYILYIVAGKFTGIPRLPKAGLSILLASILVGSVLFIQKKMNETNDVYLIPEGYEGDVYVIYNVKGAPKVQRESGYEVHHINEKGYFSTSTPDMDYGTVTDKYFYVDEKGNRTPISEKCISLFGTGGYSTSENEEIDLRYTGFRLTKSQCSDEFRDEHDQTDKSQQTIIGEILNKYYGMEHSY